MARDDALYGVLWCSTMVIVGITLRVQWAMWFVREKAPGSKRVITPRQRYGRTLFGQLAAIAAVFWPLLQFGVDDTFRFLDVWRQLSLTGWLASGAYWAGLCSPALTVLTMVSIHRRSAVAARRVRGGSADPYKRD